MRFKQYLGAALASLLVSCEGGSGDAGSAGAPPPGPAQVPANLWSAPAGATPASGNHVFLDSTAGDPMGQGVDHLHTSNVHAFTSGAALNVYSNGWAGRFLPMDSLVKLEAGFYGDVQRTPGQDPAQGGMFWVGQGRSCSALEGWFVIDEIRYDAQGLLTDVHVRFSQKCDGSDSPLRGEVRWARSP